jgi:site-specific recombinase XerD
MTEVTKQDVVAFRNSFITQVSAKTVNHDLKALKMLFKSARRDGVLNEDPTDLLRQYGGKGHPKLNAHLRCRNFEES